MTMRLTAMAVCVAGLCAPSAAARDDIWVAEWQHAHGVTDDVAQAPLAVAYVTIDIESTGELLGLRRDPEGDAFGRATFVFSTPNGLDRGAMWAGMELENASAGVRNLLRGVNGLRFSSFAGEGAFSPIAPDDDEDALVLSGRLGAIWRFGEGLAQPRDPGEAGSWYLYAGADAQALTWRLGDAPVTAVSAAALRVEDVAMIGDAQAGFAYRLGPGDLTFGFVHREIRHESASADEQFGGVSFVMSH